jgi:hypothetical protein
MKIILSQTAWQKIKAYTDNCPYEIGGLGQVTTDGVNFYVSDAEIFTQKVTEAHVDMTAETLATFQFEKLQAKQSLKDYKFWWHSHAKMGVFFSGTDTATIDSSTEFPWLVSIVTNHKHELVGRVDIYVPVHMYVDKVTVEIEQAVDTALLERCKQDIKDKVTFPTPFGLKPHVGFKSLIDDQKTLMPTTTQERVDELEAQLDELEEAWYQINQEPPSKKRDKREQRLVDEIDMVNKAITSLKVRNEAHLR